MAEASAKLKLEVPLVSRISFLFTGKIGASYVVKRDSTTTISSTEISEFEKLKPLLTPISNIQLTDIENSSTSLRVAGGYLKIIKGGIEGVDTKEFKTVMDSYDGYDTYKVDEKRYVRFNNAAFVFFDELDKCPEYFFSAFYTLFDNVQFKDATYDVDVSGIVIVLTSNYHTEEEMKAQLGLPIYYRIDKFIHFDDFGSDTIYKIVQNEILSREDEYEGRLTSDMVYAAVSPLVSTSGENARTIKYKVQRIIEELLFQEVQAEMSNQQ